MIRKMLAVLLLAGPLAACETPPTREPFPKLTYTYLTPYRLAVGEVQIVDAYRPPNAPPNVEQNFPASPEGTAEQWARDRLKAVGGNARAVYTVLRGDAIETHLKPENSGGMLSDFTVQQSERYDLNIAVRLQVVESDGRVAATVNAAAMRSRTVAQDATLNDRERAWFEMTEQTMKDLNDQLEKSIPAYMQRYLR
jgi:hypothetical protein